MNITSMGLFTINFNLVKKICVNISPYTFELLGVYLSEGGMGLGETEIDLFTTRRV